MKAVFMSVWMLVGLFIGLAFGGYVPVTDRFGQPNRAGQAFQLFGLGALGLGAGFGIAKAVLENTK
jgi:hypothetical protein